MRKKSYAYGKINIRSIVRGFYALVLLLVSFFIIGKSLAICVDMGRQEYVAGSVLSAVNRGMLTLFGQIFPLLRYEEDYGGTEDYVYESEIPDYFYEDEDTKSQETILALEGGEIASAPVDMAAGSPVGAENMAGLPAAMNIPVGGSVTYTEQQLKDFDFLYNNFYVVDSSTTLLKSELQGENLLSKDLSIDVASPDYKILIYHT
ncbi:MAG: hypothetical protein K2G89_05855, partial [Lachnospiraceae bacterium]|nr:hypothetical protein [Lachnospiraceae bacterium]